MQFFVHQHKGYKSPNNKNGTKRVFLEREECETHVGKYEVFCQKVQDLKQLQQNTKEFIKGMKQMIEKV